MVVKWANINQRVALVLAIAAVVIVCPLAQESKVVPGGATPGPQFDAASIKLGNSGDPGIFAQVKGDTFTSRNTTLEELILQGAGYRYLRSEIIGGDPWVSTQPFAVMAKAGKPNAPIYAMLRNLLAERFGLRTHEETQIRPSYRLVVGRADRRLGAGLVANPIDCLKVAKERPPGVALCYTRNGTGEFQAKGAKISELTVALSYIVGRRVIDKTDLVGGFDIKLNWDPQGFEALSGVPGGGSTDQAPSLFTAIQEQLGLRLESASDPVKVLVIDAAHLPTEN
jgi:uncharacterized protein (TIGR03435 family)